MTHLPQPVLSLIASLKGLPGVGPRSAERLALHLVQTDPASVRLLADCLVSAREKVAPCGTCGALTETQPCIWCADPRREARIVCVVERPTDVLAFERSGSFRGRYHVLGGKLSPLDGVGPEDLSIASLLRRIDEEGFEEMILALSGDVEGDATAHYLAKVVVRPRLRVTRLAQGIPAGAGLEYADELTLSRALEGRRSFT